MSETLVSIFEGVSLAQKRFRGGEGPAAGDSGFERLAGGENGTRIAFDIALTVAGETERTGSGKAGIGIKLVEASVGREKSERRRDEHVSRISFTLPLVLPPDR